MRIFKNQASSRKAATRKSTALLWAAIEPLESRMLLTSVVVNSVSDTATGAGIITLRDAIATANSSTTATTITFSPTVFATAQTITLDGTELELTNSNVTTTIKGPAAGVAINGNGASQLFYVSGSAIMSGITFANGSAEGSAFANDRGGAIENVGDLTISDSLFVNNKATYYGGAINEDNGNLDLTNVTLTGNKVGSGGLGGAISLADSGNLDDVTITGNTATYGGGIDIYNQGGLDLRLANTIVAGNTETSALTGDLSGTNGVGGALVGTYLSLGHNLIGNTGGSTGWISSDLTGTAAKPLSPKLGALANNGGPTKTLLPLAGSPVLGAGSVALIPSEVKTDQRGLPRVVNGKVDIGAVEVQPATVITVKAAAAQTATAGKSKSISLGSFTETDATAPFKATVKWGDGSANSTVDVSAAGTIPATAHTFAKAAAFTVTVTVADSASHTSKSVTFKVTVAAPVATASVSGTVFDDANGDGKLDDGEHGSDLWTVDLSSGGKLVATTMTGASGDFSFTKLAAGTYVVKVGQPAGTEFTKPTDGTLTLTLTVGEASTGNLFGEKAIV